MTHIEDVVSCTADIVTVSPWELVADAARVMGDRNIGAVVVVDEEHQAVGVLSERDILRQFGRNPQTLAGMRVEEIMTANVISCSRGATLAHVNRLMVDKRIRHLPIVENGKPVAMVSSRDVMAHQLKAMEGMRDAADRMAKLLKCFKTLSVEEVLEAAASEVPNVFQAARFTMSFDDGKDSPALCRRGCPGSVEDLAVSAAGDGPVPVRRPVPDSCRRGGCSGECVLIPLTVPEGVHGHTCARPEMNFVCLCGWPSEEDLTPDQLQYKVALVQDILATTLYNAARFHETHRRSMIDALTGVWTRRALQARLHDEVQRSVRYRGPFCVAFLDVDHFKSVNDTLGHAAGDTVLRGLADILSEGTRTTDMVARYGGDEFVVLMPQTHLDECLLVINRLRERVVGELAHADGRPVTLSGGLAAWEGETREEDLLARADAALYQAKDAGRNRIVAAAPAAGRTESSSVS
ncbi:MAG: diguanylate cyclase [Planctomycetota bacterium]|nr:diguanylate cyclase [Planctomycetota bacterium]